MDSTTLKSLKTSASVVTLAQHKPLYVFIRRNDETIGDSRTNNGPYPDFPATGFVDLIRKTEQMNNQ